MSLSSGKVSRKATRLDGEESGELWEEINGKHLPNGDRIEHTIVVDSEVVKEKEFQATSASVCSVPSAPLFGQIGGRIGGDKISLVQLVSAITGSSWHSLGKRPTEEREMAAGSKESSMSRERKRRRPLQTEKASRIASDNCATLGTMKGRKCRSKK